jgi:hypothetical protein
VAGQNAHSNLKADASLTLARYYHRSPELISYQEVADWLYYLIKERELSASSVNIAVNAVISGFKTIRARCALRLAQFERLHPWLIPRR